MHEDFVYSDGTRLLESLEESWEWSTRRRRKTESCRNTVGSTLSGPVGRSNRITGFLCYFVCFQNSPIFFRYLKDFFSSVLDLAWSRTLLGFAASFLLSWFIFAAFWSELFVAFHFSFLAKWGLTYCECSEQVRKVSKTTKKRKSWKQIVGTCLSFFTGTSTPTFRMNMWCMRPF